MAVRHIPRKFRPYQPGVTVNSIARTISTSPLCRYFTAVIGPLSAAAGQFVLSVLLLSRLTVPDFGRFSFIVVISQLGIGVWSALFSAPLLVAVARTGSLVNSDIRALAVTALVAQVPAAVVVFGIALLVGADGRAAALFACFCAVTLTRQVCRAWELAYARPSRAMLSDIAYALAVGVGASVLALAHIVTLAIVGGVLLLAAITGFFPLLHGSMVGAGMGFGLVHLPAYGQIWQRDSRWSLGGVLTTEITVNCHSYLVAGLCGAPAFAPIAATALLIRPVTVGVNALVEFERARFGRALAQRDHLQARIARRQLHLVLLALWGGTAIAAAVLLGIFPQLLFHGKFPVRVLIIGGTLWLGVALVRSVHSPEGAILQAAGEFRQLAFISLVSCMVSLTGVLVLIEFVGPLWSIGGIIAGEGCFAIALWRAASGHLWRVGTTAAVEPA